MEKSVSLKSLTPPTLKCSVAHENDSHNSHKDDKLFARDAPCSFIFMTANRDISAWLIKFVLRSISQKGLQEI